MENLEMVLTAEQQKRLQEQLNADNFDLKRMEVHRITFEDLKRGLTAVGRNPKECAPIEAIIQPPRVKINCDISQFEQMMKEHDERMKQLKRSQYRYIPDITSDALRLEMTCESVPEQYDVFYGKDLIAYIRYRSGQLSVNPYDKNGELAWQNDLLNMNFHNGLGELDANIRESVLDICKSVIVDFYKD